MEDAEYPALTGERHEDRADAFDYEHFFLHSGMGNYSADEFMRRNSYASIDSTETAKPDDHQTRPESQVEAETNRQAEHAAMQARLLERNVSVDSVSTVASFATATEGDDDEEDEPVDENGLWELTQQTNLMSLSSNIGNTPFNRVDPTYIHHRDDRPSSPTVRSDGSHTPTQDNPDPASKEPTLGQQTQQAPLLPQPSKPVPGVSRRHTVATTRTRRGWSNLHPFSSPHQRQNDAPFSNQARSTQFPAPSFSALGGNPGAGGIPGASGSPGAGSSSDELFANRFVIPSGLDLEDYALFERMLQSLSKLSLQLQAGHDPLALRARLEGAKRVLDGG